MGKAMAFDWGLKRIGIAVTDELRIIASGLTTVENKNIFPFISDYILQNKVDDFRINRFSRYCDCILLLENGLSFDLLDIDLFVYSIFICKIFCLV